MYDLTLIRQNGGVYINSREVAEIIGKRHDNLLRDIAGYINILTKYGVLIYEETPIFVKSNYVDAWNRTKPCYLIARIGADIIANKLAGEKGVLFTTAYATRFREMEAAEMEAKMKIHARPGLGEFNAAVKNVLGGMSYAFTTPTDVMKFLRGVYEPLGIEVQTEGDYYGYFTATEIASLLGIFSFSGKPHGHAVAAIINKLKNVGPHTMMIPYGLVGVTFRYDSHIVAAVRGWIEDNNNPSLVPHHDFDYHIYYTCQMSLDDYNEF